MTRNHWMLFGFFLPSSAWGVRRRPAGSGRVLVWLGAVLAWLGIAVAIERKPWPPASRGALLQAIVGASAVAIAMSATRFSLAGVGRLPRCSAPCLVPCIPLDPILQQTMTRFCRSGLPRRSDWF